MIEIDDLEFRYEGDGFGLSVAELRITAGETVALIGPSGCGKSTLLNLVAGIEIPDRGDIRIDGRELTAFDDAARRAFRISSIGMVFQEFELLEYLNVGDNIRLPFFLNAVERRASGAMADVIELAESLGLQSLLSRRIDQLSHGERQRVAIGRALITRPSLLLADEPTGNLDPSTRDHIVDLLMQYATDRQATLIMATHDHTLINRFDRVIDFRSPELSGIALLKPVSESVASERLP